MKKGSPEGYNARPANESRLRNLKPENPMNVNHYIYIGFDVHKKTTTGRGASGAEKHSNDPGGYSSG
jgi:hypothetical protein